MQKPSIRPEEVVAIVRRRCTPSQKGRLTGAADRWPGRTGFPATVTMTHDYKRNGTTTLFAALDVLTGVVIGECIR